MPDSTTFPAVVQGLGAGGAVTVAWSIRATAQAVHAVGVALLAGQGLEAADSPPPAGAALTAPEGPPPASVVVSRSLAAALFGGAAPAAAVGRTLRIGGYRLARVIGVVSDFRYYGGWVPQGTFALFLRATPVTEHRLLYVARTAAGRRADAADAMAGALGAAGSGGAISVVPVNHAQARYARISGGAIIVLGWVAVLIVGVAVSGSLALSSFSVAERTRQVGVRRALGATRFQILQYFMLENGLLTLAGLTMGLLLSVALNLVVTQLQAELALTRGAVLFSMATFWVTGQLAALVPARRAAAIPPWAATRTL